ncbi:MAG: 3-phosphoshikimate 1-carboxyvinyltransferase [Actinobacteria bacterium]|nr:3-phosphoshikimate 1-carboxyvinyltransferase [Actinomycetota bacterium]
MKSLTISASSEFTRSISTPGDKSISHRALMLSALANGKSVVRGLSLGEDVGRTANIMRQLGATIEEASGLFLVTGLPQGLRATDEQLYCGNSGTTIRLLLGILSGIKGTHRVTGDASLSRRPMDRVAIPLNLMGVRVKGEGPAITPPLTLSGSETLQSIDYTMPRASAQVKSALLLAGLFAHGITIVREDVRTRANTEEMLSAAGIVVTSTDHGDGRVVTVEPGRPQPCEWNVPGDPSQAAFFVVAGLIHPRGDVKIAAIYDGAERLGYLSVLNRMGAHITQSRTAEGLRLHVRHSELRGTTIHCSEIPSVDEVPALVVAACAAAGETVFVDMSELRIKESDRFTESIRLAEALGGSVEVDGDNFSITGMGSAKDFLPFEFDAPDDHRMAMASSVAAFCGQGGVIHGVESVDTSFPGFFSLLTSAS